MVLYIDSYRADGHQTAYYRPRQGVLGRRDACSRSFLQQAQNRQLIRQEFEGAVRSLVNQSRWETLHWLYETFPARHIRNAPQVPLQELRGIIEHTAQRIRVGDHTGWDEIRRFPATAQRQRELVTEAIRIIREGLRSASGERAWHIVYGTPISRGVGGHVDAAHPNWADALVRFVRTINELRQGRPLSRGGRIPNVPVTITAHIVGSAQQTWNERLTDAHHIVLAEEHHWRQAVPQLWQEVKARLTWGIQRAGSIFTADSFDNGRYRHPPQGL